MLRISIPQPYYAKFSFILVNFSGVRYVNKSVLYLSHTVHSVLLHMADNISVAYYPKFWRQ